MLYCLQRGTGVFSRPGKEEICMSEGFTVSARQTGRPAALTGDRERECYELLERLGIAYE